MSTPKPLSVILDEIEVNACVHPGYRIVVVSALVKALRIAIEEVQMPSLGRESVLADITAILNQKS